MQLRLSAAIMAAAAVMATTAQAADKVSPLSVPVESLKGGAVTYVKREGNPGFMLMTPAHASFAMIGALAAAASSSEFYKANDLSDPADSMSETITRTLTDQFGMVAKPAVTVVSKKYAAKDIATQGDNARYVLDVQTRGMGFMYMSVNWNSYQLTFMSGLQLIDTENKNKVIASGTCTATKDDAKAAPGYGEITANNAAYMKARIQKAADECAARFTTNLLGVSPSPPAPVPPVAIQTVTAPAGESVPAASADAPAASADPVQPPVPVTPPPVV